MKNQVSGGQRTSGVNREAPAALLGRSSHTPPRLPARGRKTVDRSMPAARQQQLPLCCPCGSTALYRRGLCQFCYNRRRRSRARFGGGRERVLARDHYLCRICRASAPLAIHHRKPSNVSSSLITLCRACHARLHRLRAIDRWVPELLEELWAEQHPRSPHQPQLPADLLG